MITDMDIKVWVAADGDHYVAVQTESRWQIYPKPIEMHILALNHPHHHPAERLQVTDIKTIEFHIDSDIETTHHKDGKWVT